MDRAMFDMFATMSREPLLLVDAGGDVLWTNQAAAMLTGVEAGGLAGRRLASLVDDDEGRVDEYLVNCLRNRGPVRSALVWRGAEEGSVEVDCEGTRVGAGERGDALVGMRLQPRRSASLRADEQVEVLQRQIHDLKQEVEDRKRAERSLRETEARLEVQERALRENKEWLRFTQRSARAGSWEWDLRESPEGRIVWSEEFYALCGLEPGSLEPSWESWTTIVHADDAQRVIGETHRSVERGEDLHVEFRVHHPVNGERWLVTRGRTEYDEQGHPLRMAGIAIDVTERKRAEIAARFLAEAGAELSSSLDYEATLRTMASMVVPQLADWCAVDIVNESGEVRRLAVTHIDPRKVKLAHELQRRWPATTDGLHGVLEVLRTGMPEIVPHISDKLLRRGAQDEEHLEVLRELGLNSYLCVPLIAHGRVLGALTLVAAESARCYNEEDLRMAMEVASRAATAIENAKLYAAARNEIEERRRAERELARHAEDLARSNAELEDFAFITSHDLKEPLRGISSCASFLLEDYGEVLDEGGRERLHTLMRLSKRMYSLLDALMEHARLGRVPLDVRECDLGEVTAEVLRVLGGRLEDERVSVEVGELPRVACDRHMARQLLTNLLLNAIEYNISECKRIQVGSIPGEAGSTPIIYVRDNGIGIAKQHLKAIFRMFKRLHHRDQHGGGLGFGLTIARRIVERHGGRIWAESGEGEGATLYFSLGPSHGEKLNGVHRRAGPLRGSHEGNIQTMHALEAN